MLAKLWDGNNLVVWRVELQTLHYEGSASLVRCLVVDLGHTHVVTDAVESASHCEPVVLYWLQVQLAVSEVVLTVNREGVGQWGSVLHEADDDRGADDDAVWHPWVGVGVVDNCPHLVRPPLGATILVVDSALQDSASWGLDCAKMIIFIRTISTVGAAVTDQQVSDRLSGLAMPSVLTRMVALKPLDG